MATAVTGDVAGTAGGTPDENGAAAPASVASAGLGSAIGGLARAFSRVIGSVALDASSGVARLGEAARAVATGRRPGPATLRVRVVILSDEQGRPLSSPTQVRPAVDLADAALLDGAGVRVRLLGIETACAPAPPSALDTSAHRRLLWDDIVGRTALFRELAARDADTLGLGVPITVVVVRSIAGRVTGCSLGINADWVVVEAALFDRRRRTSYDETVLAHELGHALNLPHHGDQSNLMFPESSAPARVRGTALRPWQAALVQANRHVVPGTPPGAR